MSWLTAVGDLIAKPFGKLIEKGVGEGAGYALRNPDSRNLLGKFGVYAANHPGRVMMSAASNTAFLAMPGFGGRAPDLSNPEALAQYLQQNPQAAMAFQQLQMGGGMPDPSGMGGYGMPQGAPMGYPTAGVSPDGFSTTYNQPDLATLLAGQGIKG